MKLFIFLSFSFFQGFAQNTSIYNAQVSTVQGQTHALGEFKGKKILIVVLPVSQTAVNASMLSVLDSFSSQYASQVAIIGVPSIDEGYTGDSAAVLNNWYKQLAGTNIILCNGLNTGKTNTQQDPVFAWLTHASQNGHFDQDVDGAGEIFFMNESGALYGIISSSATVNTRILKKMCQLP
jgi:glutathione peroxidase-family protein